MAREFAKWLYNSAKWKRVRLSYIASVHGLCEECGGAGYIVHHKIHLTPQNINDHNIAFGFNNLKYVCKNCHEREHNPNPTTVKGAKFDSNGDMVYD